MTEFDKVQQEIDDKALHDRLEAARACGVEVIQFFAFAHLPDRLKAQSRPFAKLACQALYSGESEERTMFLRKLLEAKDCFVRIAVAR